MKLQKASILPVFICLAGLVACGDDNAKKIAPKTVVKAPPAASAEEATALADEINQIVNQEVSKAAADKNPKSKEEIRSAIASKVIDLQKDKKISDKDFLKGLLFLEQESLFTYLMKLRYLGEDREFQLPQDEKVIDSLLSDLEEVSDPETGELAKAFQAKGIRNLTTVQAEYQGYNQESRANFMAMRALGFEPTNGAWESPEKKKKNQAKVDKLLKREKELDRLFELNDEDYGRADAANLGQDPISLAEKRGQKLYKKLSASVELYRKQVEDEKAEKEAARKRREEELRRSTFPE